MVRKKLTLGFYVVLSIIFSASPVLAGDAASLVEDLPTVQSFTADGVAEEDITRIIHAGINSPSAMNQQPWHFSVITDPAVTAEIASGGDMSSGTRAGILDAPVVIVISCKEGSEFDAGLATQTMSIEAQLLGYGTKIFTSPTRTINGARQSEFRRILEIPDGMTSCAVLIVGVENKDPDAVSSATVRYSADVIVSYVKKNTFSETVETITDLQIPVRDITDFYYTYENINYNAFYQRYRFYTEDGKYMLYHETREKPDDYGWTTEEDITANGTIELSESEWFDVFELLKDGTVRIRNLSDESGDAGPWMYLYWKDDQGLYQEYSFSSYETRILFETFCAELAQRMQ